MNTNEIIGRAVAEKTDPFSLKEWCWCEEPDLAAEICMACGNWFLASRTRFDTDHNAIAHAREVLLDTDEKRANFARALYVQLDLPDWDHSDFAELLDHSYVDASPADQSKAMIEALGLEGK